MFVCRLFGVGAGKSGFVRWQKGSGRGGYKNTRLQAANWARVGLFITRVQSQHSKGNDRVVDAFGRLARAFLR